MDRPDLVRWLGDIAASTRTSMLANTSKMRIYGHLWLLDDALFFYQQHDRRLRLYVKGAADEQMI